MQATASLAWDSMSGATSYRVEYKLDSSADWIIVDTNHGTNSITISDLLWDTLYNFKVTAVCNGALGGTAILNGQVGADPYRWMADSYVCEADAAVFTLQTTITGLSSPQKLMYDQPTDKVYGVDIDSVSGHFFYFNPATFASPSDVTYIPNFAGDSIYSPGVDKQYRRLYAAGKNTGGLVVYDIESGSTSLIPFGMNDAGNTVNGNGFNRISLTVLDSKIYAIDVYSNTMLVVNRETLAYSVINITSIPSGSNYLSGATLIQQVGNELWVSVNQGPGSSNIGRFNLDFTSFWGEIDISAYVETWSFNFYWRSAFFDVASGYYFVNDTGSNNIIVIDPATNSVHKVINLDNRSGKSASTLGFVLDPVTNDLYITGSFADNSSDTSSIKRTYLLDRATLSFANMFVNIQFSSLALVDGTNVLYGADQGYIRWSDAPEWSTDGKILKYTR